MKTFLKEFNLLGNNYSYCKTDKMTCYNNFYPFGILQDNFKNIEFEPITILYGGNGSGKSTILNIIAETLNIKRNIKFNKSSFFDDYIRGCKNEFIENPLVKKILTSDDVFNNLFNLREKNEQIDDERSEALIRRRMIRSGIYPNEFQGKSIKENYERLSEVCDAISNKSASSFVRKRVGVNLIGKSNGETAMEFFANEIKEQGLYLLDEPENSLSANYQIKLMQFLLDSARFFDAQLVVATHSPFILSLPGAKIYNLDTQPVSITYDWTTLENMQSFYRFFKENENKFEK